MRGCIERLWGTFKEYTVTLVQGSCATNKGGFQRPIICKDLCPESFDTTLQTSLRMYDNA